MEKGLLVVISGPSGTGKGTICRELLKRVDATLSISMTTRAPRPGEKEGRHYYFTDRERFEAHARAGGFFEHAEVYGERYGTPKEPALEALAKGRDVILEIDTQGAMQVREAYPEGVFIFVVPPSLAELKRRIEKRGGESPEKIALRLSKAEGEMAYREKYDYAVVNDKLARAVDDVRAIIRAEHLKVESNRRKKDAAGTVDH
ncbi:MAG: guanylate kinase [Clostridiales Family XIII bacterium]|jgi:guanylate kinase|nr:guanylate kinase [Clostridiales Family XIII bacterium]